MSQEIGPVICDGCGKDITYTGYSSEFRLVLKSEAMALPPDLTKTMHFCNRGCLQEWLAPKTADPKANKDAPGA